MTGNGIKFEFARALVRARKDWGSRDRSGNYVTVALAVYNYSNGDGMYSYASAKRVSEDTGIRTRTVERALSFLRDEGLIHQDQRGGRSGDGTVWASEYSLRIPARWSDAAAKEGMAPEPQPAATANQPAATEPQPATSACQPAALVADHQIRSTTSDSSDPNTTNPAPDTPGQAHCAPGVPMAHTRADDVRLRHSVAEPDWDAMAMAIANQPEPPW